MAEERGAETKDAEATAPLLAPGHTYRSPGVWSRIAS